MSIEKTIINAINAIKNGQNDVKMSITNVSKIANISRQTIYNYPELIKDIKEHSSLSCCSCNHLINELKLENEQLKKVIVYLKSNKFEF